MKKIYCGRLKCNGHNDYTACGEMDYGFVIYQCTSCKLKEAQPEIERLRKQLNHKS